MSEDKKELKCILWLVGIVPGQGETFENFLKKHVKPLSFVALERGTQRNGYQQVTVQAHEYYQVYTRVSSECEANMRKVLAHMNFYGHVISVDVLLIADMSNILVREL